MVVGRKLLFAGALLAIHLWGFARYSLGVTIQQHHIDAARASVWGFLAHFGHVYLAGLFVRCMFYAVYYTTDAIAIAAGFGYMGRDSSGRPDWSGCNRMDILGVEFAPHVVILARSWNKVCVCGVALVPNSQRACQTPPACGPIVYALWSHACTVATPRPCTSGPSALCTSVLGGRCGRLRWSGCCTVSTQGSLPTSAPCACACACACGLACHTRVITHCGCCIHHGRPPYGRKLIWCCSWVPVGACVRLLRWRIKPWFFNLDGSPRNRWSKLYTLSGYVVTQFYITYGIATYFVRTACRHPPLLPSPAHGCPHNATWQMIDVETSIRAYSSFLYLGHILALGAIPLLLLCPVPAWAEPYKGSLAAVNSGANHTSVMPVDAYYTAKPGATSKAAAAVARTRAGAGAAAGAAGSRAAGAAGAGGAQGGSGGGGKPRKGGARQRRGHKARG